MTGPAHRSIAARLAPAPAVLVATHLAGLLGRGGWGIAAPLLVVWLAAMLATPGIEALDGRAGGAFAAWLLLTVILQALVVVLIVARAVGTRGAVRLVLPVLVLSYLAEALGAATDLPFGAYDYTELLAPHLLGVPLVIPLAWLMMLPPAWAVARVLVGRWGGAAFVGVAAVAITAWDLFLDPQMVLWGVWRWDEPSGYFGIPFSNYVGWLLVAAIVTIVARPERLPTRPLLVIYTLVCVIEVVGLVLFWSLPGPALVGGLVMGAIALVAWGVELGGARWTVRSSLATGSPSAGGDERRVDR